jgi:hypothetical protein
MLIRRGLLAEFSAAEDVPKAAAALHNEGYRLIEVYSPFPMPAVEDKLRLGRLTLGKLVFGGGLLGAILGYGIQWYADVRAFPVQVGGRPLHAVPAFIPATFEATVLLAALTAFFGCLYALRLPELWHPVFEVEGFERATADRFWIAVDQGDPLFDAERTRATLTGLGPIRVVGIPESQT